MQIISEIARQRRVEKMVAKICRKDIDADLADLCQIVYTILCEYDAEKIVDLWQAKQMDFFLARIILNQYKSDRSPYYWTICRFRARSFAAGVGGDLNDARIEQLNKLSKERKK